MPKFDVSKLDALPADVRSRVESALHKTLESEIAANPATKLGDLAATHSRSRGAVFSRSRTGAADTAGRPGPDVDAKVMEKIDVLDDAAFERFTSRLAALKGGVR